MSSTASASASDSDSDLRGGRASIPPTDISSSATTTTSSDIDVTAQPATITWRSSDGEDQSLSNLQLDLHYHARSSKAFCKLRAAVALKSHPRARNTAIFLFLHPERVQSLVLDDAPCAAEARELGSETVGLQFSLSRCPALFVPKESLAPRNQASGNLLDSLRAAAQQATFSIYAKIPTRHLPRQRLVALCQAVSRNELKSIEAHSNDPSAYGGVGGRLLEGDGLVRPVRAAVSGDEGRASIIEPPAENPPSYDDLPPGPPPALPGPSKRRRLSSPETDRLPRKQLDRKYIEDICAHMIENKLGHLRRDVAKQLKDLENRVIDYVDEQLTLQQQRVTEDIGQQTEDEYYGLKVDIESYVRDEVGEAEDRILDRLSTASFSIQLNP
ncbi:hypothetical protein F4808DRAFT_47304 [Astrocystis sublimbata]|nr:hypothetical protein F4808DRAFT_47304 [Astrocystis sublimbata]